MSGVPSRGRRAVPISLALALAMTLPVSADAAPEVDRSFEGPTAVTEDGKGSSGPTKVPSPRTLQWTEVLDVAVGLSPEAPGSRNERDLLDRLAASVAASTDPPTTTRRLRPGVGSAREVCRSGAHDLTIMLGYVPAREEPVILAHDCSLDIALELRSQAAVDEPGLVGSLWAEHDAWIRQGVKERRRRLLGPKARVGIITGVALAVAGIAIGSLIAVSLRKETVVLTVGP